jgi:hypothetical protein
MQKERGSMVILRHSLRFTYGIFFSPGDMFSTRIKQVQILDISAEYWIPQCASDSSLMRALVRNLL